MMKPKELLVVIPHSGIVIPAEISLESLSNKFPEMVRNVDWYTNWLYDFRDILDNRQMVFPYCSLILEANGTRIVWMTVFFRGCPRPGPFTGKRCSRMRNYAKHFRKNIWRPLRVHTQRRLNPEPSFCWTGTPR